MQALLQAFHAPRPEGPGDLAHRLTSSNFCRFFYCPTSCSSPSSFNDSLRKKANYCSSFYHEKQFYISRPPCFASHAFYSRQKRYKKKWIIWSDNLVPSVPYRRNLMSRTKLLDNSDWFEDELKCRENFFFEGKDSPLI